MTVLTLHILTSVPWSNLNRDDTGSPKRTQHGGVQRALLTSQALKRAARTTFESAALSLAGKSCRSAKLADLVLERAKELAEERSIALDEAKFMKKVKKALSDLVKSSPAGDAKSDAKNDELVPGNTSSGSDGGESNLKESGQSIWLSHEELETLVDHALKDDEMGDFIDGCRTGSLAIAAFGRMFAKQPEYNTEAALAVSPAVTTHESVTEIDYFTAVDDYSSGSGAAFLGLAQYTSGIFYRTITIDREQLRQSWSGMSGEHARELLRLFVRACALSLPRGKKNSTAPYTPPLLVLAEEQRYRVAYDFEKPVDAENHVGGYGEASLKHLIAQRDAALRFDPDNFPGTALAAGVADEELLANIPGSVEQSSLPNLVDNVVEWILNDSNLSAS